MTPQQIIDALRELAVEMQTLGVAMDYYGGHGEMAQHGLTQERSGGAA